MVATTIEYYREPGRFMALIDDFAKAVAPPPDCAMETKELKPGDKLRHPDSKAHIELRAVAVKKADALRRRVMEEPNGC